MAKYGPMVQLGTREETETPVYASLLKTQRLETVNFDEAVALLSLFNNGFEYEGDPVQVGNGQYGPYLKFREKYINLKDESEVLSLNQERINELISEFLSSPSLPRELGEYEGAIVQVNKGRFGPYVKFNNLFASIPRDEDPFVLTYDRAVELIQKKIEDEKKKMLKTFEGHDDMSVQKGRYGPFIKYGKLNIKIPKDTEIDDITVEMIETLAKEVKPKKKVASKTTKAKAKKK